VQALGIFLICASLLFFFGSYFGVAESAAPNPLWFTTSGWLAIAALPIGIALLVSLSWSRRRAARSH